MKFEIDSGVSLVIPEHLHVQVTSADGRSVVRSHEGSSILVDGEPLAIASGRLTLGATDHGAVAAGDEVQVKPEGVWINGKPAPGHR